MRLHRLELTAFGPFPGTECVDFDALSEAGLFLLTGPTGAGKTSVLDAVCFALYGEVPGDRQAAKRLRCDQAPAGVAPRVELELSLAGRRFRLVRSPAWERPKKRGTGVTTEQASVRFSERGSDGEWRLLSSRLDETGHAVGLLVGMNLSQFCQVALLPQGRFQAFLRARSEERHRLLHQLFRTGRFEAVERWLRERRQALRRESARHHEVVADLVSRVSEAADEPVPDDWDLHDLQQPAADGDVAAWSRALADRTGAGARVAAERATAAEHLEERSRTALEEGRRVAEARAAHDRALAEQRRLDAEADAHRRRVRRLEDARRAAGVRPLQRLAVEARRTLADAAAARDRLAAEAAGFAELAGLAGLAAEPGPLDRAALAELADRAREAAAAARALLPRERALAGLRSEAGTARRRAEDLEAAVVRHDAGLAAAPAALQAAREALDVAVAAGHRWPAAREQVAALRARRDAGRRATALEAELAEARDRLACVVDDVHRLKETWLRLREERIGQMAAELAGALAVGHDCPVCGSPDHPRPATAHAGAPGAEAEREARRQVDDAEATRLAHEGLVRDLTARAAAARELAGPVAPDDLEKAIAAAVADESRLAGLAAGLADSTAALTALEAEQERATAEREEAVVALASARSTATARHEEAEAVAAEVAAALAGTGSPSLAELADHRRRLADACAAALRADDDLARARDAAHRAEREAAEAATAAGFVDVAAALAASLADEEAAALEAVSREHTAAVAAATALLADPVLVAAAALPAPDVAALTAGHEEAAAALAGARTASALAASRAARLAELEADLAAALAGWAPVREELALTTRVAALCDGTSPDNRLQMRLSGYVLARRLGQVVDAANQRLARMSDQRYSLEHTGRRGAGETRGGLSLLVRDDWSGETRDPATLSGGETFVVSLALALGLADVIAHEVGGADLDTLFVDEGFGSLDADTLDDVMDTLDSLRDGGRVVGVVSHVAEMRDRIPVQLRVAKSRAGSSLALPR